MSCPICAKSPHDSYRPFCSRRCADVDLGRWLTGGYAIPSDDPDDAEEALRLNPETSPDTAPKTH